MSANSAVSALPQSVGQQGPTPALHVSTQQAAHGLCNFCESLKLTARDFKGSRDPASEERRSSFQKVIMPAANVIRTGGCTFCNFILTDMLNGSENPQKWNEFSLTYPDKLRISLEWIKDGRKLDKPNSPFTSTRRLRISATHEALPDAYLVLMANEGTDEQFLGRFVDDSTIEISRLQQWLTICQHDHQGCHNTTSSSAIDRLSSNSSFRLIDVDRECIISASFQPFLALSYCWGTGAPFSLELGNVEVLMQPGGLDVVASVPRTIRDAIHLTRLLGYKYLWVDSLCIIQDSEEDWRRNVHVMDAVYELAELTICAAGGKDANSGIRGLTLGSRSFKQATVHYDEGVKLMATRPAEHFVERSRWNARAWTFQERLCSRRSLIFVNDRVFYQCRQSVMCEDITMEQDALCEEWSVETRDALGRLFLENPIRQYTKCVQLYTQRVLSFSSDRLAAFAAIAAILCQSMNSDFRMGLPTSYFDFALLWTPSQSDARCPTRISNFSSWSWPGWQSASEYSNQMLEGILLNMHEWISTRTWIEWYAGDSPSEATLVWDGSNSGLQGRWKGYARPNKSSYGRSSTSGAGNPNQYLVQTEPLASSGTKNHSLKWSHSIYLRFCTHSAFLGVDKMPQSLLSRHELYDCPQWHGIFDSEGDWCGAVFLDQRWVDKGEMAVSEHANGNAEHGENIEDEEDVEGDMVHDSSLHKSARTTYQFIAISEARDFSAQEHDSWTYYVPKDKVDSQWDLYYVLLIVTNETGISERRGLGKIFKDAFKRSHQPGYSWSEIVLG